MIALILATNVFAPIDSEFQESEEVFDLFIPELPFIEEVSEVEVKVEVASSSDFTEYHELFDPTIFNEWIGAHDRRDELLAFIHEFREDEVPIVTLDETRYFSEEGIFPVEPVDLLSLVEEYVKEGSTVIECGAANGLVALGLMRFAGERGLLVAFESNEKNFRELFWNLVLNNVKKAKLFCQNLDDEPMAIDDLKLENVSLIKIHSEGREDLILAGARETIMREKPVLIITMMGGIRWEWADKYIKEELKSRLEAIEKMGYTISRINGAEYLALPIIHKQS